MLASRGLRELTNLHTLPRLELGDDEDGWSIDELGGLQNLTGEIRISGLEHVKTKENARKAELAGKAKVSNITLAWARYREEINGGSYDEDVLDGLQPHPNLISLELYNFYGLMFPSWMVRMAVVPEGGSPLPLKNLTSLKLLNCSRCQMLPTLGHLPCLKYLVLSGLKVESIGSDFYGAPLNESNNKVNRVSFPSLTKLVIYEFDSLKTWVLPSTGKETIVFPLLDVIELRNCPELETIPALDYFQSLKKLELLEVGIQSLDITKHKPSSMLSPEVNLKLESLVIYGCAKLVSLPSELQYITSVKTMNVCDCPALTCLPNDLFRGLASLRELSICRCEALSNIPTSLEKCASLAKLRIHDCPYIEGPMPDFRKLKSLQEMYKSGNPIELMISMFKAVEHLPDLKELRTGRFKDEVEQEMYFSDVTPIHCSQSLLDLSLDGNPNIKSRPEQLQLLTQINNLSILDFDGLEELPEWVGRLSSLEELWLVGCKNLKYIPSKEVFLQLTQLRELRIWRCPILAESCVKDVGSDWSKISHIPLIVIDRKAIQ